MAKTQQWKQTISEKNFKTKSQRFVGTEKMGTGNTIMHS